MRTTDKLDRRAVKELEKFLKAKRATLQAAVRARVSERRAGEVGRSSDEAVWAAETLNDEIQLALVDRGSREVAQIEAALERLGRGEYGLCHDCGEFIGVARLRALPFAQRCSPCQTRAERQAHRWEGASARPEPFPEPS